MALIARLRSIWSDASSEDDDGSDLGGGHEMGPSGGEERGDGKPRSNLFRCPECEVVYIATEKSVCSHCDEAVKKVPSTLSGR